MLDLSRLSFIDSSGVHAVVEKRRRASRENVRPAVIRGPSAVERLFEICGLTTVLPSHTAAPEWALDAVARLPSAAASGGCPLSLGRHRRPSATAAGGAFFPLCAIESRSAAARPARRTAPDSGAVASLRSAVPVTAMKGPSPARRV